MATHSRVITRIGVTAALYAVLTLAIAPISYGPVQLRISEIFKVAVLLDPLFAVGIGLGSSIANVGSPFGLLDIVYMPITDILGGLLAWWIFQRIGRRTIYPSMLLYAITTGVAVGVMLAMVGLGHWYILAIPITVSEAIILLIGGQVLWKSLKWLNLH